MKTPAIGEEHVSGLFWIVLAVVFYFLPGSWTAPLSILLEVVTLVLVITIVFMTIKPINMHAVTQLPATCLPGLAPEPRDPMEREIQALEFRYVGDFDVGKTGIVSMRVRAYISRDLLCGALLADMTVGKEKTTVLEFGSDLSPAGSILTNNFALPSVYSYRIQDMKASVPWKLTADEIFALHKAMCQVALDEEFTLKSIYATGFAERLSADMRKENDYQVERGRLRRVGKNRYRMTLLGALIGAPLIWYNMAYGGMFAWYKPQDSYFCWKLRRRLRRYKQEQKKAQELEEGDSEQETGDKA